jgi:hypothetical protein
MAYTIIRSDGSTLTTIQDGTINTTSTSLGLPGRSYAGYGQTIDTNFVRILENFASASPPANPLRGQLWFNTTRGTLNVCPADNTVTANSWLELAATGESGTTTFGNVAVTGNLVANNIQALTDLQVGNTITTLNANVTGDLYALRGTIQTATLANVVTQQITSGNNTTSGTLTGIWTVYGQTNGNAVVVNSGNLAFSANSVNGIKCDNYMYANGVTFNPAGTYTNSNVSAFLTGANGVSRFTGNIAPTRVTTTRLDGGGVIAGIWTLAAGARLQATYADLAERFEADDLYDAGTVVELGGEKEITAVRDELSESVFGVVSNTAAYLMNTGAGEDNTHPPVAISGRVQVKVHGKVKKGDRLVSAGKGYARAAKSGEANAFNTIGRSLADKTTNGSGTVEAIVVIK